MLNQFLLLLSKHNRKFLTLPHFQVQILKWNNPKKLKGVLKRLKNGKYCLLAKACKKRELLNQVHPCLKLVLPQNSSPFVHQPLLSTQHKTNITSAYLTNPLNHFIHREIIIIMICLANYPKVELTI